MTDDKAINQDLAKENERSTLYDEEVKQLIRDKLARAVAYYEAMREREVSRFTSR